MLKYLTSSANRIDLLGALLESPITGAELEKKLDAGGSTTRRNLRILRDEGWVERDEGQYMVADGKQFLLEALIRVARRFEVYETDGFWETHDLSPIPENLLRNLEALHGGEVVRGSPNEPLKPLRISEKNMLESTSIKVLSPAFVPEYLEVHRACYEQGVDVELVLTGGAIEAQMEAPGAQEAQNLWREQHEAGGLRLYRAEEFNVVLAVGDDFVAINLPRTGEDTVDLNAMFLAHGPDAVGWGERLFAHYQEGAEEIRP